MNIGTIHKYLFHGHFFFCNCLLTTGTTCSGPPWMPREVEGVGKWQKTVKPSDGWLSSSLFHYVSFKASGKEYALGNDDFWPLHSPHPPKYF